jgi:hypothetical protein
MITPWTDRPLSEVIDPAVGMKTSISNALDTTRFWTNQNGISLHFVEIQPIFHLGYGILVRKWLVQKRVVSIAFDIYVFIATAGSITSDCGLLVHGVIIW